VILQNHFTKNNFGHLMAHLNDLNRFVKKLYQKH
jgi:hypothetical protein